MTGTNMDSSMHGRALGNITDNVDIQLSTVS